MDTNTVVDLARTTDLPSAIHKMILETPIVDFGIVQKIIAKGVVLVQLSVTRRESGACLITCPLLSFSSANLTLDIEPKVGDKVLVLYTRTFSPKMFDLNQTDTIVSASASGYNLLSGVAILWTQYRKNQHNNVLHVSADDGTITLEDSNGCTIVSSSESIKINNKLEIKK